jgi:hypothetical protein
MQRYLAKTQYGVPRPGIASTFDLAWPAVSNFRVWQGDTRAGTDNAIGNWFYTTWVDDTKEPRKRA